MKVITKKITSMNNDLSVIIFNGNRTGSFFGNNKRLIRVEIIDAASTDCSKNVSWF